MKPLIVANWKCNFNTLQEVKELFAKVQNTEAVICPPFVYLFALSHFRSGRTKCVIGAQDCFWENSGSYTGEVSPLMLKNLGVEYVIVGHSERRKHQKETDAMIAKKAGAALSAGLKPILCIDKLSQLEPTLTSIKNLKFKIENLVVAFEPLSAVGTGHPYDVTKAAEMYRRIGQIVGEKLVIIYGGSVNASNATSYIKEAGFQGLLIGASSLNPKEFTAICAFVGT